MSTENRRLGITATEDMEGATAGISTNVPTELACRASAEATWIVESDSWFCRFNEMMMPTVAADSVSDVASLLKQINRVPDT